MSQYRITLSRKRSRKMVSNGESTVSLHSKNFSRIHASSPTGESTSEYPMVCGAVAMTLA